MSCWSSFRSTQKLDILSSFRRPCFQRGEVREKSQFPAGPTFPPEIWQKDRAGLPRLRPHSSTFKVGDIEGPARKFRTHTAPSASRMTRMLLVALSVAGRRAKQPTGAPNASHHGGKNSNCRRYVQNEGDISRWCGRIAARDQPGTPDILVTFPLVSIHDSP